MATTKKAHRDGDFGERVREYVREVGQVSGRDAVAHFATKEPAQVLRTLNYYAKQGKFKKQGFRLDAVYSLSGSAVVVKQPTKPNGGEKAYGNNEIDPAVAAYALGYTHCFIEGQARSAGVSTTALADRLGRLLLAAARR